MIEESVADAALGIIEVRTRTMTEVQMPSLEYGLQKSTADTNRHALQEEGWPEFTCASIYQKSKRKTVTFADDEGGTPPSAAEYNQRSAKRKDDEEKEEPCPSKKEEETTLPSELEEAIRVSPGHEGSEVEMTLNKLADSPLIYMALLQDSRAGAKEFGIPEQFSGQVKRHEIDQPFKPDASDSQTSSADGQARPVKDLANENIQSVTVKKLREIQFSPTTFRRRTISANINVTEQNIFSREGVGNREEEMHMLHDIKRHKLYMELPESYRIHLAAQEDAGIAEEQVAEPSDAQKASTSHQFLSLKPPVGSTSTGSQPSEESGSAEKWRTVHAVEKSSVSISCVLEKVASSAHWTRNGSRLEDGEKFIGKTVEGNQCVLEVHCVKKEDAGEYVCVAETEQGCERCSVNLQLAEPPYIHVSIEDVEKECGRNARFDAVIEGTPKPEIAWYKDGNLLSESDRITFLHVGAQCSLVLLKVTQLDAGVYICIARNIAGDVQCNAALTVIEEAKVKEECSMELSKRRKLRSYYDVKEEIGRGSYGFVKRVVNKQSGTSCAAKFIPLRRSSRSQAYEELAILSRVNHSKIACLIDMFETKRALVLVLEMCSNEELLDHLFKKNIVAEAEVRYYIQQILEGVQYLHDNNILHLDIKPANILMAHPERDDVKICDFGFAQEVSPAQPQFSKYGRPEFVAPEIVSQDPVSTATDIWAIGVITFLCLTGNSPFAGENDRVILTNVKEGSFSWNERDLDCISEDAQNFIKRIIRIIPQNRPTASECLKEQWFQEKLKLQESCTIKTKRLKFFISRNKWQRSLMCYKSILVMRSIPQLLEGTSEDQSLGMSRHLFKESSSSTTSASSSDLEDCTHQTEPCSTHTPNVNQTAFDQYFASEHCENQRTASSSTDNLDPNTSEHKRHRPVLTRSVAVEKQVDVKHETGAEYGEDVKAQNKYSETCEELNLSTNKMKHPIPKAATIETSDCSRVEEAAAHNIVRGISADSAPALQISGEDNLMDTSSKPPSRLLPRHCLIKSTFHCDTLESRDLSTEDAQYARSLERMRKRFVQAGYTKGKVSGLRQPLLECFQMDVQDRRSADERFEETSRHSSGGLAKSASYDNGDSVAYAPKQNSRRSKSLDECEAEFLVQTTARESASEILEPFPQQSDPNSNTMTVVGDSKILQPVSLGAQESDTQKSTTFKCTLSDTVCLSEEVTLLTDLKCILECPTKNIPSEIDQSVQTDAASPPTSEKEQNKELSTEKKTCLTDIEDDHSQRSVMDSSAAPVASLHSPSDLQNKDREFSQSFEDTKSSSLYEPPESEAVTTKGQYYDEPTHSHLDISGIRSFDLQGSLDSELQSETSSVAASVLTCEPQEQSSSENVSSLYFDAVESDTDYFDLSEPYSCEMQYGHCPTFLFQEFEEKSASQTKPLPVPCTSEELFPSREAETKKDSPLQGKLDQTSTTSYEILCDETEPVNKYSWNLTAGEWESDLLELLDNTEQDETTSDIEEGLQGESKKKKKSKRTSLENKIHQSFESLRKAFKSQKDAKTPTSSSETSLTVSETHTGPVSKSTSKTFGRSGLLRLFSRSASLNWDKGLYQQAHDEDGGGSRYSLSVLQDFNSGKQSQDSRGKRKSQTLPARFSLRLNTKDSAEKPKLRKENEGELSEPQASANPPSTELQGSQYMEVMKMPLISPLTPLEGDIGKQQMGVHSTDTRDNPSGSLKKKSRLFSFRLPSSKAKEKAPSFLEDLRNQSVVLSQSVTLSCRLSGYPNPDILWFKDDQPLCCSDRILSSTTSKRCQLLTILNVAQEDLGSYKCVAESRLGKASTCCLLNLAAAPCRPDSPEIAQVYEDGALVIWKPLVTNTPIMHVVECQRKGEDWKTVASDLSESCFYASNLRKGESYSYRVAYVSKAGKGPFSQPSAEVIIGKTEVQSHSVHGEKLASVHQTHTFLTEINRGRFSIIKKCTENSSGKSLAAKITPYKKQNKPFVLKEYETLKKLHHSNIVQLHGAYITPEYLVLIQELCEGKELFRNLAERSSYTEHDVGELLQQVLGAVEYLHLNHTLHLDLKSENMIIVEHNVLKLLDFGNAEILMPGRPVLVEKCRDFVENMAPEILEGKAVVPETDIWAVGVLTFTMLSGDCPFMSDKDCDKEKNIRKGKIKLGRCYAGLSQGAVSFLKNTLCLNPGGRPCASECRLLPWLQEESKMKLRCSTVSFQTTKLRNYLKQREKRRMLLCTKHEVLIVQ